jgi:single-strand DNA-binding protein
MRGFNKVILMGNLTRDPQLKYLPSQTAVAEFGIAMNRKWRDAQGQDREEVCFVDCSAFGKTGEFINQYFTKGKPILLEGRLKLDQWEDKQGGGKRSKLSVVVETASFVGGPGDTPGGGAAHYDADSGSASAPQPPRPMNRAPNRPPAAGGPAPQRPAPDQPFGEEQQFKEDDIPF